MRRFLLLLLFLFLVMISGVLVGEREIVWAEDCDGKVGEPLYTCLGSEIDNLSRALKMSQDATAPLETEVEKLGAQIKSIQNQIDLAKKKQGELEEGIEEREAKVADQYVILAKKTREFYKQMRSNSLLVKLLSSMGAGSMSRDLAYRAEANDRDRMIILQLSGEIGQLEADKLDLEERRVKLAGLQASLDKEKKFFDGEIGKAKAYQSDLQGKIASLTSLQQSILAGKAEVFSTTVGDVPLADDPNSRPDYNPGFSPAFAAFSFGAPHFKGMSQYGAFGRAKSGQKAETILQAYYGGVEIKKDYDAGKQIGVSGYGRMDIETYVKRVYEMPGSWGDENGMEALKAQAVAARSYALAWTREGTGGSICTTQACQVYKNANKGGKWEEAVNATRGWVLYKDGKIVSAWYASTSGGYQESYNSLDYLKDGSNHNTPAFWDAEGGRDGWTSKAWESRAGSPWFYKGWYKSRNGSSCGRSHPWLTAEEMADVVNAWVVLYQRGESDSRIAPVDVESCWGKSGVNPYSIDELRGKGGYGRVTGVSVMYRSDGVTDRVTFQTDKGSVAINGREFYKAFNLRAPARIALKSGLFNIEQK